MRKLLAILTTAAIVVGPVSTAVAQVAPDIDCDDPSLYSDYQDILRSDPSDPNDLDRDNDGEACDEFGPGAGSTSAAARPVNNLRREVGYEASTGRTFQLAGQPPVPAPTVVTISPPRTGDAGVR